MSAQCVGDGVYLGSNEARRDAAHKSQRYFGYGASGGGSRLAPTSLHMRAPRLLYLTSAFPYGRSDTFFGPEARELVRQGVELRVIPMRPRGSLTVADAKPWTVRKPLLDLAIAGSALIETVRAPAAVLSAFRLLLRQPKPKVLVRNLAGFPKALWIAREAKRWGADHIHAHWAGPPSTAALVASRVSGVPWSFTAHFADIAANNLLEEKSASATFCRFIARSMMELARQTAPNCDESGWVLLHLGVDLSETYRAPGELNSPAVLLTAARFDVEKRHRTLVEATRTLVEEGFDVQVWLAGAGPLKADVQRQVQDLGLEHVIRFLGFVLPDQLLEWLSTGLVDLVVLPSDAEGIPVSLMEALAHGVPAVACDAGGVTELLGEGCGEVVPPGDADALAVAIAELLHSPERRASLAQRGRERLEREFAVEPLVEEMRRLLGFAADTYAADGHAAASSAHPAAARQADSSATGL